MASTWACAAVVTTARLSGTLGEGAQADPGDRIAQGTVKIPTDAQINRMERDSITTPPLDVSEGGQRGSQQDQIRQMDRRDRRIDQKLRTHDGVCDDC
ncbi:hypothetical protein [Methylobacterium nigriterrae]|uniref:hypothetical protein n=1 Tax=Methylobacterium nigriterrae TaxID=3127512 RepID=UPI0030133002